MGAAATFLIYGQSLSDPVTVAIVSASMPIVGITLEVLLDRRRLTLAILAGLVLSIVGGLIALDLNGAASGFGLGAVFCLISVVLFAVGSRLTVTALPEVSALGGTALTVTGAGLATVLVALAQDISGLGHADWGALSTINWIQLCFFSVFSMALTQVLWIMSVGRLGIATAALHINAAPFYVMLILFALGAPWNWHQALGALVVGLGVMVAQNLIWQRRPRRADA
jgi:drug/metabolite transporter (DMT)-like permease